MNNFGEASFRSFDALFLGHRKNKRYVCPATLPDEITNFFYRIDRLVLHVISMFNYYRDKRATFHDTGAIIPIDKNYIQITETAMSMWEHGLVVHNGSGNYSIRLTIHKYVYVYLSTRILVGS